MNYEHIYQICRKIGVSLFALDKFNNENKAEIEQIRDIFNLQGNDKEKVLVLLYMLSLCEEDDAVKKYREQTRLDNADSGILLDKYKDLLLSALIYLDGFYAMAENYRYFVSSGLPVIKDEEDITQAESNIEVKGFVVFFIRPRALAAPDSQELTQFDSYTTDDGVFEFHGNKDQLEVWFRYKDKEAGEPAKTAPCNKLVIELITKADNVTHNITLDRPVKSQPSTIRSAPKYIDYSQGFDVKVLPQ